MVTCMFTLPDKEVLSLENDLPDSPCVKMNKQRVLGREQFVCLA